MTKHLSSGEIITQSILKVLVEFSKALEVAEYGEHAPSTKVFDITDAYDRLNDETFKSIKRYAQENQYDTIVIQKTTYEEEVFYLEEGDES